MNSVLAKLGIAIPTSLIVAESLELNSLWTALVSFAVSIITIVGGEIIKFLVAYFKNKTEKLEQKDNEEEKK